LLLQGSSFDIYPNKLKSWRIDGFKTTHFNPVYPPTFQFIWVYFEKKCKKSSCVKKSLKLALVTGSIAISFLLLGRLPKISINALTVEGLVNTISSTLFKSGIDNSNHSQKLVASNSFAFTGNGIRFFCFALANVSGRISLKSLINSLFLNDSQRNRRM
jgi:hypothetical protein